MAHNEARPVITDAEKYQRLVKSAVSWLYIIAAMTFINAVLFLTGSETYFVAGVFFSQIVSGVVLGLIEDGLITASALTSAIVLLSSAVPAVLFALFGWLSSKRRSKGAAVASLVLLSLDTLLFIALIVLVQSFDASLLIDFAVHGIAIYSLIRAIGALKALPEAEAAAAQAEAYAEVPQNAEYWQQPATFDGYAPSQPEDGATSGGEDASADTDAGADTGEGTDTDAGTDTDVGAE